MIRLFWVALAIVVFDQWTKHLALTRLVEGDAVSVMPFVNFALTYNTGAAFGFLNNASGWQNVFFIVVAIIVSIVIAVTVARLAKQELLLGISLMLILGGAIGNLIDRVRFGKVVDFIDVYYGSWHFYTFNVADSAITIGAIFLLLDTLGVRLPRRTSHESR